MSLSTIEEIEAFARRLADGETTEPLSTDGEGALASISASLNKIASAAKRGPDDDALFARGPVVVFRWRNIEGWPVEFVSTNVEGLTGYPVEEFSSDARPYASLIEPQDLARVTQEVADNSGGTTAWFEHQPYRIRHRDGRTLWVYDYTVILRDEGGAPTHFYGYIMDMTERVANDELIQRQAEVIVNLGAPVLQVWDGVVAVPLVGLLDNERAAVVTDALLGRVSRGATSTAILDLTGVDMIDTSTAHHLGKMIRAVGLLGCECVISGMSASVAQIVVGLDIDFRDYRIYRTLAAALSSVVKARAR